MTLQYITLYYITLWYITFYNFTLFYISLHYITLSTSYLTETMTDSKRYLQCPDDKLSSYTMQHSGCSQATCSVLATPKVTKQQLTQQTAACVVYIATFFKDHRVFAMSNPCKDH